MAVRLRFNSDMQIEQKLLNAIHVHHLIPPGSRILVAVSGGADSLVLLHLLHTHQSSLNCTLHVATLDHGLRGDAGANDVGFVVETAGSWGLDVTAGKADVPALARERGLGTEAAARLARYDFLANVAHKVGADRIAVAHHADDQAETALMHLLRGAGLAGLAGMGYRAPLPGHADFTLIRPLLNVTRAEIEGYCRERDLQPRQDVTNEDTTYTRNRLRHEVLPYLETLYPQVKRSLIHLADIASVENEFVEQQFESQVLPQITRTEGRVIIPRSVFNQQHPAIQRRFIRWSVQQLERSDDLAYDHIVSALEIVLRGEQGAVALLSGGVQMRVDYEEYVVELVDAPIAHSALFLPEDVEISLHIPGNTVLGSGWVIHATFDEPSHKRVAAKLEIPLDSRLLLRTRREGDRFVPLGMGGHTQKVGKWMIDHKIPRGLRDAIPLLEINGQIAAILWGKQWAVSEHFAVRYVENRIIYLGLESPN